MLKTTEDNWNACKGERKMNESSLGAGASNHFRTRREEMQKRDAERIKNGKVYLTKWFSVERGEEAHEKVQRYKGTGVRLMSFLKRSRERCAEVTLPWQCPIALFVECGMSPLSRCSGAVLEQVVVGQALVTFSGVFTDNLESTTPPDVKRIKKKRLRLAIADSGVRPHWQVKAMKQVKKEEECPPHSVAPSSTSCLLPVKGPSGNSVLFQGHFDDPLEELREAYSSQFGLRQSCVPFRFKSTAGEVMLSHRSARELGFTLGGVFYALYWDPELGTWVM